MTADNYVITGRLNQPAAARENGYCGLTYFLESSCFCCVIVGLLPWYSQAFDQMLVHSIQQAWTLFIYSLVSGVVHC